MIGILIYIYGVLAIITSALTTVLMLTWRYVRYVPIIKYAVPVWFGARFTPNAPIYKPVALKIMIFVHFLAAGWTAWYWRSVDPCIGEKGKVSKCGDCKKMSWKTWKVVGGIIGSDVVFG